MTNSTSSENSIKFTKEELKQLQALEFTIDTLSKMLRDKTDNKYAIVQREMVEDLNEKMWDNVLHCVRICGIICNNCEQLKEDNYKVTDKWESELKAFTKV